MGLSHYEEYQLHSISEDPEWIAISFSNAGK